MTYTIKLCGGPGEGRIITTTQRPPGWRVPVLPSTPVSIRYWESQSDPTRVESIEMVEYHDTGMLTPAGEHLYATTELLAQLHEAMARPRPEGMLSRAEWESVNPSLSEIAWTNPALLRGAREYPWDAIKREDTERLIKEIDEVTGDDT
jgi:hypothetical protein